MENKKSKKHVDHHKANGSKHEAKSSNRHRKSQRAGESGVLSFLGKSDSENVTQSRITREVGLYALGRTSTKIKRDRLSEEQKARAKEDLDTLLQLATKNKPHTTPSLTSPVFATPFAGSSVKKARVHQSKSHEDDDGLLDVVKLVIDSSSDSESVPEEKLLEESFDYVSKGLEVELADIMEDEDKNFVQETKRFLRSVHQQRFARTDPAYMLFSDTTFQTDFSSSSKSEEMVDVTSEISSAKVQPTLKLIETQTRPQVAVSAVPSHSESMFTFSPEIVELTSPFQMDEMCNIYLDNFPALSASPSELMSDRSGARSPRLGPSSRIVSPFVSPVPRFHPHRLFNK